MDSIWYDTIDVQLEKNKFSISDFIWRGPSGGTSGAKSAVILYAPNSIPSTLRPWLQ